MRTLSDAIALATLAHHGQLDKAGHPYILHPLRVMLRFHDDTRRMAAILHDVVEDTFVTLDYLRRCGFVEEVVEAVDALTRREGETYFDSIRRCRVNPVAEAVKFEDVCDNLERIENIPDESEREGLRRRYEKTCLILDGHDTWRGSRILFERWPPFAAPSLDTTQGE